jgi:hypothetical protein
MELATATSNKLDRAIAPPAALLFASVLFRLPPLMNAAGTNSDAAIVGVQAMHILRGEWSWFLFGSGYQTSIDSLVAAIWFLFTGPSPLALMLSTFVGHHALLGFVYSTLRRYNAPWPAAILCLPLVFTTGPLHTYILYPPRQAALTLAFAAVWVIDGASVRSLFRYALGAAIAGLACFADPYGLLFAPLLGLLGLLAVFDGAPLRRDVLRRLGASAVGAVVGLVPYWLLTHSRGASHGQTSLSTDVVVHNARLLWDEALPCVLGTRVYYTNGGDYEPWAPGAAFHAVQIAGAVIFLAGILSAGALFFRKSVPWEIRRLGAMGLLALPLTLAGFLVSPMVMDFYSARYLVAFVLMSPFALAPMATLLAPRKLAALLAPFAIAAAASGWLHYGRYVDGPAISTEAGKIRDEQALAALLRDRSIHAAIADYWASYRLTFLFREDPFVVPTNPAEDRYKPQRDAFEAAQTVAYIYDPLRSRERPGAWEDEIRSGKTPFAPSFERLRAGAYTVLILERPRP